MINLLKNTLKSDKIETCKMNQITPVKSDKEKLAELVLDYYQDQFVNMTTCRKLELMKELADKILKGSLSTTS